MRQEFGAIRFPQFKTAEREQICGTAHGIAERAIGVVYLDHLLESQPPLCRTPRGVAIGVKKTRKLAIASFQSTLIQAKSSRDPQDLEIVSQDGSLIFVLGVSSNSEGFAAAAGLL